MNEIYIMGDLNVDIQNQTLTNNKWKHIVELNDLHQLISEPTRITARSETIIDHLYASRQKTSQKFLYQKLLSAITTPYITPAAHPNVSIKGILTKKSNIAVLKSLMKNNFAMI